MKLYVACSIKRYTNDVKDGGIEHQGFEIKNNHVEIRFITFFLKYNVFFIYIIHMLEK